MTNVFAVFVQHTCTNNAPILRIEKSGPVVTLSYSADNGVSFTKGMSGYFSPAQVRIGLVANEMGKPFGGDGKAHFAYIEVLEK
ncbi:MAG: hypothetical protein A2Y33_11495 [Spirochaetes bacterium GWF1_51_8]|nr:MAG: hypothetical protein A2Y33_11495 [Spirochaetes bacterium GWF1_51_8]